MTYGKKKDRAMAMCFRNALFRGRLEAGENGCFVGFLLGKSKKRWVTEQESKYFIYLCRD